MRHFRNIFDSMEFIKHLKLLYTKKKACKTFLQALNKHEDIKRESIWIKFIKFVF